MTTTEIILVVGFGLLFLAVFFLSMDVRRGHREIVAALERSRRE